MIFLRFEILGASRPSLNGEGFFDKRKLCVHINHFSKIVPKYSKRQTDRHSGNIISIALLFKEHRQFQKRHTSSGLIFSERSCRLKEED
jgi:hypothetical protein